LECLTAVSSRQIDDRILTLSASGWTYFTTFVLYDYETESLWFPLTGAGELTCVSGTYADRVLGERNSVRTEWYLWKQMHPGSLFMTD
jgi:hypothetical protein